MRWLTASSLHAQIEGVARVVEIDRHPQGFASEGLRVGRRPGIGGVGRDEVFHTKNL